MEETMTVKQVLEITVKILNEIEIPVSMMEKVGAPVMGAIGNLKQCIEAVEEAEQKAREQQGKQEDPSATANA